MQFATLELGSLTRHACSNASVALASSLFLADKCTTSLNKIGSAYESSAVSRDKRLVIEGREELPNIAAIFNPINLASRWLPRPSKEGSF